MAECDTENLWCEVTVSVHEEILLSTLIMTELEHEVMQYVLVHGYSVSYLHYDSSAAEI